MMLQFPFARPRSAAILRNQEGAATVLLAGSMLVLLAVATVSIDLASIYLAKRKLQGVADAAAMAAAQEMTIQQRRGAVLLVLDESHVPEAEIDSLENGTYAKDKAVAIDQRFQPGGDQSATRVALVQTVPLFFGKALGFDSATVRATATAAKIDMAAYSLGTRLAAVSGGIPNEVLSALIGTDLDLSVLDSQGLASANVDVLGFADALKAEVNAKDVTYAELFGQNIAVSDVIAAIGKSTADVDTAALLQRIADDAPFADVALADIIDLGPYGRLDYYPGKTGIEVDAYSLLRTVLELSHGDVYDISFDLGVTGLAHVDVRLTGGRGMAHSPWLTVTGAKDYVLRSSQARMLVTAKAGTNSPFLPSLTVPVYAELAQAEATLEDIQCTGDPDADGVTLGVSPSPGQLGIGTFDPGAMTDFSSPVMLEPANLANVPLVAKVTGLSEIALGGTTQPQDVLFTLADIRDQTTKTVGTNDITQSIASSLVRETDLGVTTLGLQLSANSVTTLVGNTLGTIAPILDRTIYSLTEALGLKVGAADVRVDKVRCGMPSILA